MPTKDNNNLAALFVAHAQGYVTRRALEIRRVRYVQCLQENKYTISQSDFEKIHKHLDAIEKALNENAS